MLPRGCLDDAADVEHHHHALARGVEGGGDVFQQLFFVFTQVEVGQPAVEELARGPPQGNQCQVVRRGQVADAVGSQRHFDGTLFGHEGGVFQLGDALFLDSQVCLVSSLQTLVGGIAGSLQAVQQRDGVGAVHVARARAACNEVVGRAPVEGDVLHLLAQGQGVALVLQQHHAFSGRLSGNSSMGLQVGLVAERIAFELGRLENHLKDTLDVEVQHGLIQLAALHAFHDVGVLAVIAGLQHVVASLHLGHGVLAAKPVGHHHAGESPLVAQQRGEQFGTLGGIDAVQVVIRRHHRPRLAFLDSHLEAFQIDFAQGTLRHAGVVGRAVGLLVVHGKVFDAGPHAVALHAAHVGSSHLAAHHGVFGVILKVASAQRVAVDVEGRCQQDVGSVLQHLVANGFADVLHQVRVPRRRQQGADGEVGAVIRGRVALALGVYAQTGRPVGQYNGRDAQALDGIGGSGSSGHDVARLSDDGTVAGEPAHAGADEQVGFFFQGHGADDILKGCLAQLRCMATATQSGGCDGRRKE